MIPRIVSRVCIVGMVLALSPAPVLAGDEGESSGSKGLIRVPSNARVNHAPRLRVAPTPRVALRQGEGADGAVAPDKARAARQRAEAGEAAQRALQREVRSRGEDRAHRAPAGDVRTDVILIPHNALLATRDTVRIGGEVIPVQTETRGVIRYAEVPTIEIERDGYIQSIPLGRTRATRVQRSHLDYADPAGHLARKHQLQFHRATLSPAGRARFDRGTHVRYRTVGRPHGVCR